METDTVYYMQYVLNDRPSLLHIRQCTAGCPCVQLLLGFSNKINILKRDLNVSHLMKTKKLKHCVKCLPLPPTSPCLHQSSSSSSYPSHLHGFLEHLEYIGQGPAHYNTIGQSVVAIPVHPSWVRLRQLM